ncbi:unnamed protein product [Diamesa hyperborea]
MKTVQVLGSLFVICLVSFNFAASSSIGVSEGTAPLAVDSIAKVEVEAVKEAIVEATTASLAADVTTAAPVVPVVELKNNVETLITEIMAAVVPTIVASVELKEATVVVPEVAVAKTETVVVIDEALTKKDYLPKSATEDKVVVPAVPAVTEVVAEIVTVPSAAPVVVEPVVATTEEAKKSDAPLVETIKTEVKPESSTASSSDSVTSAL